MALLPVGGATDGDITTLDDFDFDVSGALTDIDVTGDFDGATVSLHALNPKTGDPGLIDNTTKTLPFSTVIESSSNGKRTIRATVAGGGGSPVINIFRAKASK